MEDFAQHIEPEWDANPDRSLLCIRYKGRRIGSINPAQTDSYFCRAYTPPVENPKNTPLGPIVECDVQDFLEGNLPHDRQNGTPLVPVLVQSGGKPCMRYAAVARYISDTVVGSNCIHAAAEREKAKVNVAIIIAGDCVKN